MIGIDLKTALAEIDATGTIEKGRRVALRYVTRDGDIRHMIVSKRVKPMASVTSQSGKQSKSKPHYRDSFLIPIIDHTHHDKPKDLFALSIIGFNPEPDLEKFFPIIRPNDGSKTE